MTARSRSFTEEELVELWAAFGDDQRFGPLQHSHAVRLAAVESASRLASEMRRLRAGAWIDAAAREVASSPQCGDVTSSNATAIARVIRRHVRGDQ